MRIREGSSKRRAGGGGEGGGEGGETSFPGLPVKGWVKNGKTTGVTGTPPLPVPSTGT